MSWIIMIILLIMLRAMNHLDFLIYYQVLKKERQLILFDKLLFIVLCNMVPLTLN